MKEYPMDGSKIGKEGFKPRRLVMYGKTFWRAAALNVVPDINRNLPPPPAQPPRTLLSFSFVSICGGGGAVFLVFIDLWISFQRHYYVVFMYKYIDWWRMICARANKTVKYLTMCTKDICLFYSEANISSFLLLFNQKMSDVLFVSQFKMVKFK